jgi:hypothetical protein
MTNPGLLAYTHQARQLAAAAEFGAADWADCDCDGPFADGAEPEYYDDRQTALRRYFRHKLLGTRYWAVHCRWRHLLHVHSTLLSLCPECRRRHAAAA